MIPVIALTGYLGAGKTSLLNHLLTRPGTRVGVIINDLGKINVDTGLITSQVDAAESIAGGCVCCLEDSGSLDELLEQLARPTLRLDAIIVETSGAADPINVDRLLRYGKARGVRYGGIIDVVDAVEHRQTVDTAALAPARFTAASLVVVNKLDAIDPEQRSAVFEQISARVHERNPQVPIVGSSHAAIDPQLVFDIAEHHDPVDQLPLAAAARAEHHHSESDHAHAVTVRAAAAADPGAILNLIENPPPHVYRLKGHVALRTERGVERFLFNVVGRSIHAAPAHPSAPVDEDGLVAIGLGLDEASVHGALAAALLPAHNAPREADLARLERRLNLSRRSFADDSPTEA